VNMPYDIDNPPAEPPAGVDPLLSRVAFALRAEHEPGPDGFCLAAACRRRSELWPCEQRQLADAGLMGFIGRGVQRPHTNERQIPTRPQRIRPPGSGSRPQDH
jgi:hypothetical protein